jgi:hypothetical protein
MQLGLKIQSDAAPPPLKLQQTHLQRNSALFSFLSIDLCKGLKRGRRGTSLSSKDQIEFRLPTFLTAFFED